MKREDFEIAAAAGLAVVLPLYKIFTLPGTCDSPTPLTAGRSAALLLVLASYFSIPLLLRLGRGQQAPRFAWLWTPVLGSLLSVFVLYWLMRPAKPWSLGLAAKMWLALCVWTILFAAAAYYFGKITRGMALGMRDRKRT